jgi:hypothetical protein
MVEKQKRTVEKSRKIFLSLFFIITLITLILTGIVSYSAFEISHDGEFCNFRKVYLGETNYDFMINKDIGCDFIWSGLKEPFVVFIFINIIFHPPPFLYVSSYQEGL